MIEKILSAFVNAEAKGSELRRLWLGLPDGSGLRILIFREKIPTNARLLEARSVEGIFQVVAGDKSDLWIKRSPTSAWEHQSTGLNFAKLHSLEDGKLLGQVDGQGGTIFVVSPAQRLEAVGSAGEHQWHGTWSLDQNPRSGAIIWGEYPHSAKDINMWKSTDAGRSWRSVVSFEGGGPGNPKGGEIRHFHVVQKCTSIEGRWYASTGDTPDQSRFLISEDDGENWEEVEVAELINDGGAIPARRQKSVFRFTSLHQDNANLYWVTDDTFGGLGARACMMSKSRLGQVRVLEGSCGSNEVRNTVDLGDAKVLSISESKLDRMSVTFACVDFKLGKVIGTTHLANPEKKKLNFTNGVGSKAVLGREFFTQSDNLTIRPGGKTLRYTVEWVR